VILDLADMKRLMQELYGKPGHLIRRLMQISSALFAEECAAFDLTSVQYAALVAIRAHPEVDATRLSALIAFDRSTLGDVLERLEAKGWVLRSPSPSDRRVKLLRLSPERAQVLEEVEAAVRRVQERILAPLDPEGRATFMRLLTELVELHKDVPSAVPEPEGRRHRRPRAATPDRGSRKEPSAAPA
jgi:DNA-binding MarR family transcriptional regulator